jgi:hypothetical protein
MTFRFHKGQKKSLTSQGTISYTTTLLQEFVFGTLLTRWHNVSETLCKSFLTKHATCHCRFPARMHHQNDILWRLNNTDPAIIQERFNLLTLILLTSTKWWAPASAIKWQMGFNSAFKGLKPIGHVMHQQFNIRQLYILHHILYLCVLYLSENKQRLVQLTA